jgi:hypothetical protein
MTSASEFDARLLSRALFTCLKHTHNRQTHTCIHTNVDKQMCTHTHTPQSHTRTHTTVTHTHHSHTPAHTPQSHTRTHTTVTHPHTHHSHTPAHTLTHKQTSQFSNASPVPVTTKSISQMRTMKGREYFAPELRLWPLVLD